jgi:hypothetical protein
MEQLRMNTQPNWKKRYEELMDLLSIASPLLAEVERDGLTNELQSCLGGLRALMDAELTPA